MTTTRRRTPILVELTPRSVFRIAGAVVLALAAWTVASSARSVLATALACGLLALLFSGPVDLLSRRMHRAFAIILTLLLFAAFVAVLGVALVRNLDHAFTSLQRVAPEAAHDIESSTRYGQVARDLHLAERVDDAVATIRQATQHQATREAFHVANYFVGTFLTIFILIYGRRLRDGALRLVSDDERRALLHRIVHGALVRGRRYLLASLAEAIVVGGLSYVAYRLLDVPAAVAVATIAGIGTLLPTFGIVLGQVVAVLLALAFRETGAVLAIVALAEILQALDLVFVQPRLARHALHPGPAVVLIAVLVGAGVYGVGGAIFGAVLAVLGLSVLEAAAAEEHDPDYGAGLVN